MQWLRRTLQWGLTAVVAAGLVLIFPAGNARAQEEALDPYVVPPAEWEVEEAVDVLRRYLAVKRAERAREAASSPDDRAAPGGHRLRSVDPLVAQTRASGGVTAADAPTLGDASLTLAEQLHLADTSAVFKNDQLFLWDDTTSGNLALGRNALSLAKETASNNTALGYRALQHTIDGTSSFYGSENTAVGGSAMRANTTGHRNSACGFGALRSNTTGDTNTASGLYALRFNTTGSRNTASGALALEENTVGIRNTASGYRALENNSTGSDNVALGFAAGYYATSGSDNIFLGSGAFGAAEDSNTIRIGGSTGTGELQQNRTFIAGIDGIPVSGTVVKITADGQLGVTSSSYRYKESVRELENIDGRLLELRPVTFRYRAQMVPGGGGQDIGLIAEEVARVFPELVTRDEEGRPFGVKYRLLSVLLLDELQRQHAKLETLHETRAELQAVERRLEELEGRLPVARQRSP